MSMTKKKIRNKASDKALDKAPVDLVKVSGLKFKSKEILASSVLYKKMRMLKNSLKIAEDEYKTSIEPFKAEIEANGNPRASYLFFVNGVTVKVTKAADQTVIVAHMRAVGELLEAIKPGLFWDLAKVGITDLRQHLTEQQMQSISQTEPTGARLISFE